MNLYDSCMCAVWSGPRLRCRMHGVLDADGDLLRDVRLALGGLAHLPDARAPVLDSQLGRVRFRFQFFSRSFIVLQVLQGRNPNHKVSSYIHTHHSSQTSLGMATASARQLHAAACLLNFVCSFFAV